ncbi:MAG: FAD-dependent oxidoreductase [Pseudomonadota bacterium]|nr:FAD-dependent oxidoreductase [Pseudomonadota bacterium]
MAKPEFDLAVIGGGAGGLVVAAGGAKLGAKVALIEKDRLGGDCLWHGCVPSKTLLKSARVAHTMRHANRWALASVDPKPDLARVMERVAGVVAGIAAHDSPERFRSLGVDVIHGSGRFISPTAFDVNGRTITAKHFVLATGSRPAIPPIAGLADVPYLTNQTVFALREPVPRLIIAGAGPIGSEMAQAFRRLGSDVIVVDMANKILPREDADVAAVVQRQLEAEGVRYHLGISVGGVMPGDPHAGRIRMTLRTANGAVEQLTATHLMLAAGRVPNVEGLGLDAAGVHLDAGGIAVDAVLATTNPRIHVVGDIAGTFQFAHVAEHHAGIVLRQTLFRMSWSKPSPVVPWCTYTDPELARVGLSEAEARRHGIEYRVYRFPFDDVDRARAEGETEGFAKLVTDRHGRLLGAAIVGADAGELIAECVLAIGKQMSVDDLSAAIHAYPTRSQVARRAADERRKEALTPSSRAWMRRIFGLRGT